MKTILIVEDTPLNLELLIQILEDDYHLTCATDGASGIALAEADHPDLIIMDMALPLMDGYGAVHAIRSNQATAAIPVIGLSAHAMKSQRDVALRMGCDAYLTKPVDERVLLETIDHLIGV